jgi:23S rRNA pseudouridine2605 synthase
MEEMILAGRITVNREPADIGQKVSPGDEVRINGELVKVRFAEPRARILMYHKPAGEIVTRDDPEGRPTVFEKLPPIGNGKWIAIGRLDFNTEGLLLFTNSGELANKMMHPRYEVEREYAVRIMGVVTPEQQQSLLTGIELDDGPAKVEKFDDGGGEGSNHWYHIVVKEGRNREVRRLFEALGLTVSRLIRTRYGSVAMPSRVKRGQTLELTTDEVGAVLTSAGMRTTGPGPQNAGRGARPPQGKGPRPPSHGQRDRGPRPVRQPDASPSAASEDDVSPETDVVEPGNSVHGLPTHGNTPVGKFFSKGHGKSYGRPQGQGGPRQGGQGGPRQGGQGGPRHGGQGGPRQGGQGGPRQGGQGGPRQGGQGQGYAGRAFPQQGRPHGKPRHSEGHGAPSSSSPYVVTTLTIPGGVPEGLPGTGGPRANGEGPGHNRPRGPGPGQGKGPNGAGGGQGKKRGRGNRHRNGPNGPNGPSGPNGPNGPNRLNGMDSEATPGNNAPPPSAPTDIDDDIGNR